jgi:hypothetical protein
MSDGEAFSVLEIPTAMYTSSPKSLVSETNDFGDDVYIAVGISNTEKASPSDISDDGDERLSLSHAGDKKEISTGILLEGNGERGGKSTKLSIFMGLVPSFCSVTNGTK